MYADRNTDTYEQLFEAHLDAMTVEELHSKSAIAAELAYRDYKIVELEAQLKRKPFTPDWDRLQACRDSVEEHQQMVRDLQAQLKIAFIDGYNLGHGDTVEGRFYWCKQGQSEKYDDYAQSLEGKE